MTVSASICSVMRMMPISAVSAEPARPVTMSAAASGRSAMHAAVDSQRPEREVRRVQVVLEVEDAREAGAVPERVLPRAIGALSSQEILDAARHGGAGRAPRREEAEERPGA